MKYITWTALANMGRVNIVPISGAAVVLIPVIARVSSMDVNSISDISVVILNLLDAKLPNVPVNFMRSFWVSFFITVASILFKIFCPQEIKYYKDYDDWRRRSELCSRYQLEHIEEYGIRGESQRENEIYKKYLDVINKENHTYLLLRVLIGVLIAFSIYLTLRIAIDQVLAVISITSWKKLLLW